MATALISSRALFMVSLSRAWTLDELGSSHIASPAYRWPTNVVNVDNVVMSLQHTAWEFVVVEVLTPRSSTVSPRVVHFLQPYYPEGNW